MVSKVTLILLVSLSLIEITLRLQQKVGPLYDLEMIDLNLDVLSDTLNHIPPVGATQRLVKGEWRTRTTDSDGIVTSRHSPKYPTGDPLKILFLGDSFMEGYDEEYSVPGQVLRHFIKQGYAERELTFLNAGHSSYSPSIFIPQVKALVPKYRPDMIVIDIDETDLGDDYFRYLPLISRDASARITAVRRSFLNDAFLQGLERARKPTLYLQRFAQKLLHTKVIMPYFEAKFRYYDQELILSIPKLPEAVAREKHQIALSYFHSNLNELAETLQDLGIKEVVLLHHPHKEHLEGKWNSLVAAAVQQTALAHGFSFFSADTKMQQFPPYTSLYFPSDMHFNFDGMTLYGRLVAEYLLNRVSPAFAKSDKTIS